MYTHTMIKVIIIIIIKIIIMIIIISSFNFSNLIFKKALFYCSFISNDLLIHVFGYER